MTGTVRMVSEEKKFGFIKVEGEDHFFHMTDFNGHWEDLLEDFKSGMKIEVKFDSEMGPKGMRARSVSRTDWPNQAARELK